jgi:hypothetical protein
MDPTFYAWHGEVDGVVKEWLQTENGQAWAAANPEEAALWWAGEEQARITSWPGPITIPDDVVTLFSNMLTAAKMDADGSGTLDATEISDFLQSEYNMSAQRADSVAAYLVRQASGDIQSGQQLAHLMGLDTLKYTDDEKLQDASGNRSADSLALTILQRAALAGGIVQADVAIPTVLENRPGILFRKQARNIVNTIRG